MGSPGLRVQGRVLGKMVETAVRNVKGLHPKEKRKPRCNHMRTLELPESRKTFPLYGWKVKMR